MGLMVAVGLAEVITVATVLESVAAIGAVLSVVGTITKNKTLSMIGMGMAVVGGVGALAAGAFGVGDVALFGPEVAGSAAEDTAVVSAVGSEAASGGIEAGTWDIAGAAGDVATDASAAVPDVVGSLSVNQAVVNPGETISLANETTDLAPGAAKAATDTAADTATKVASGTAVPEPDQSIWGTSGMSKEAAAMAKSLPAGQQGPVLGDAAVAGEGSSGLSGAFSKVVDYAGAHPVVALGAMQAGGSLLSSAFSSLTPAQAAAANAQAAANDAAAALTNQQRANLAMPKAVASFAPVTGAPAPLGPQGLINQPRAAQVTGAPA